MPLKYLRAIEGSLLNVWVELRYRKDHLRIILVDAVRFLRV